MPCKIISDIFLETHNKLLKFTYNATCGMWMFSEHEPKMEGWQFATREEAEQALAVMQPGCREGDWKHVRIVGCHRARPLEASDEAEPTVAVIDRAKSC